MEDKLYTILLNQRVIMKALSKIHEMPYSTISELETSIKSTDEILGL